MMSNADKCNTLRLAYFRFRDIIIMSTVRVWIHLKQPSIVSQMSLIVPLEDLDSELDTVVTVAERLTPLVLHLEALQKITAISGRVGHTHRQNDGQYQLHDVTLTWHIAKGIDDVTFDCTRM
jgi:hypothetical protein